MAGRLYCLYDCCCSLSGYIDLGSSSPRPIIRLAWPGSAAARGEIGGFVSANRSCVRLAACLLEAVVAPQAGQQVRSCLHTRACMTWQRCFPRPALHDNCCDRRASSWPAGPWQHRVVSPGDSCASDLPCVHCFGCGLHGHLAAEPRSGAAHPAHEASARKTARVLR